MSTTVFTADDVWNWLCNMRPGGNLTSAIPPTPEGNEFWQEYILNFMALYDSCDQDPDSEERFLHLCSIHSAFDVGALP